MAPYAYALLASAIPQLVLSQVVHMPLTSRTKLRPAITKRDGTYGASLQNYIPGAEYYATIEVGTPPQTLELIVDTGSSDLWMFAPGACKSSPQTGPCIGGTYDSSASSTYQLKKAGLFSISYADGSGVKGNYISDDVTIAGATLNEQTMAVATEDSSNTAGIMGIGLDTREAAAEVMIYNNVPDNFKLQGLIGTKAYSLYLDSLSSPTGSLLWGGYDTDKYTGNLVMLPLLPDEAAGGIVDGFSIPWTSMEVTNGNATYAVTGGSFPYAVTMDSGSTLATLPTDIYKTVANQFQVQDPEGDALVNCDLGKSPGYITLGFGGNGGPSIAIPFSEIAIPSYNPDNGEWQTDGNGDHVCVFGFQDASKVAGGDILFGQAVLRSAYLLYDLENLYLGIANTVYDSTSSNIVTYNGKSSSNRIVFSNEDVSVAASGVPTIGQSFMISATGSAATGFPTGSFSAGASGVSFAITQGTVSAPTLGAQTFTSYGSLTALTASTSPTSSSTSGSTKGNAASSLSSRIVGVSAVMMTLGFLGGAFLL